MEKEKMKKKSLSLIRRILQTGFFIFLPALYYNAFYGIRLIVTALIQKDTSLITLSDMAAVLAVVPLTLLLGRFFCGFMCAFGSFFDFIYLAARKIFKIRFRINEKADAVLKYLKYINLAVTVVLVWIMESTVFSKANPWDVFGMLATVGKAPALIYAVTRMTAAFIIFCALIIASAFVERFYCRYLCPLGAIFALLSKLRITRIKKPTEKCGKCRICTQGCPMGIPLYKSDQISSGECIHCMKCAENCPRGNVSFTVSGKNLSPLVAGTVTATAMTGVLCFGRLASSLDGSSDVAAVVETTAPIDDTTLPVYETDTAATTAETSPATETAAPVTKAATEAPATFETTKKPVTTSAAASSETEAETSAASTAQGYKDGSYQGSGTGFRGRTTKVTVLIENGEITDITVDSYGDDRQFFERAFAAVSSDIIDTQSTDVDTVSGATYSSIGIMEAVNDALSQAR